MIIQPIGKTTNSILSKLTSRIILNLLKVADATTTTVPALVTYISQSLNLPNYGTKWNLFSSVEGELSFQDAKNRLSEILSRTIISASKEDLTKRDILNSLEKEENVTFTLNYKKSTFGDELVLYVNGKPASTSVNMVLQSNLKMFKIVQPTRKPMSEREPGEKTTRPKKRIFEFAPPKDEYGWIERASEIGYLIQNTHFLFYHRPNKYAQSHETIIHLIGNMNKEKIINMLQLDTSDIGEAKTEDENGSSTFHLRTSSACHAVVAFCYLDADIIPKLPPDDPRTIRLNLSDYAEESLANTIELAQKFIDTETIKEFFEAGQKGNVQKA